MIPETSKALYRQQMVAFANEAKNIREETIQYKAFERIRALFYKAESDFGPKRTWSQIDGVPSYTPLYFISALVTAAWAASTASKQDSYCPIACAVFATAIAVFLTVKISEERENHLARSRVLTRPLTDESAEEVLRWALLGKCRRRIEALITFAEKLPNK